MIFEKISSEGERVVYVPDWNKISGKKKNS